MGLLVGLGLRGGEDIREVRADHGNLNTEDMRKAARSLDSDPATTAFDVAQHAG